RPPRSTPFPYTTLFRSRDGDPEVFCSSADWMDRNFFRRIEVCFPIEQREHRARIIEDLETYLADNTHAWQLRCDGSYERLTPGDGAPVNAQGALLRRYAATSE